MLAVRLWAAAAATRSRGGALATAICRMSTTPAAPEAGVPVVADKPQDWGVQSVISSLTGVPEEQLQRKARIFRPARTAMSQGTNSTKLWRLEFGTRERWQNPLMGWASSADPLSNMMVDFATKEDAIAFAKKNGFDIELREPHQKKVQKKAYGDNFHWSRRTRVGQK